MAEKPILFNGDMVRALLAGNKTQTRRPVKYIPALGEPDLWCEMYAVDPAAFIELTGDIAQFSPFGKPGDVLWVRETFASPDVFGNYTYRADCKMKDSLFTWTPSIHMPKVACRIKLKVKRVWVERVQAITPENCIHEGIMGWHPLSTYFGETATCRPDQTSARPYFCSLWQKIYNTWDDNPWVWCCEFEVDYNG